MCLECTRIFWNTNLQEIVFVTKNLQEANIQEVGVGDDVGGDDLVVVAVVFVVVVVVGRWWSCTVNRD